MKDITRYLPNYVDKIENHVDNMGHTLSNIFFLAIGTKNFKNGYEVGYKL
jgi:hypothetical protein